MVRHTEECRPRAALRRRPVPAAGPDGAARRSACSGRGRRVPVHQRVRVGAAEQKTGWTDAQVLARVGTRITTLGQHGVRIERTRRGARGRSAPAPRPRRSTPPASATRSAPASSPARWGLRPGAGRPGRLAAGDRTCSRAIGTQEYELARRAFLERIARGLRAGRGRGDRGARRALATLTMPIEPPPAPWLLPDLDCACRRRGVRGRGGRPLPGDAAGRVPRRAVRDA